MPRRQQLVHHRFHTTMVASKSYFYQLVLFLLISAHDVHCCLLYIAVLPSTEIYPMLLALLTAADRQLQNDEGAYCDEDRSMLIIECWR